MTSDDDEGGPCRRYPCLTTTLSSTLATVLAAVGGFLEEVEDFLPLDHGEGVLLLLEQPAERFVVHVVRVVFEAVDLHRELVHADALFERFDAPPSPAWPIAT